MATGDNRRRRGGASSRSGSQRPAPSRRATSRSGSPRSVSSPRAASQMSPRPTRSSRPSSQGATTLPSGYESRSIGDINRAERPRSRSERSNGREKKPTSRLARGIRIAAIVIVILALILLGVYGYCRIARVFPLTNVSIQGADHLTDDEKTALVHISDDANLLDVDQAEIRSNFLSDAWVKDVSVSIEFPDTLVVNVTERQVGAVVEMKSADSSSVTNWALSTDGVWLMPIPSRDSEAGQRTSSRIYDDVDSVVHIVDVPYSTNPQIGASCGDSNVNNAVEILSNMTTELADQIKSVSATDAESTTLLLQNGVEIAFGTATDIRSKERVCLELLEQHEGEIAYINVRTVSRPTWRSL